MSKVKAGQLHRTTPDELRELLARCDPARLYALFTAQRYYGAGFGSSAYERHEVDVVGRLVDQLDAKTLIEIGVGNGRVCAEVAQSRQDLKIVGVDFSESMLDAAWRKFILRGIRERCELVNADIRKQSLPDYGDGSISMMVYNGLGNSATPEEHLAILRNMAACSKYVFISVFNADRLNDAELKRYHAIVNCQVKGVEVDFSVDGFAGSISKAAVAEDVSLISHWFYREYLEWLFAEAGLRISKFETFGQGFMILAERA